MTGWGMDITRVPLSAKTQRAQFADVMDLGVMLDHAGLVLQDVPGDVYGTHAGTIQRRRVVLSAGFSAVGVLGGRSSDACCRPMKA